MKPLPTFPPLLTGQKLSDGKSIVKTANARAAKGALGAGDLLWSEAENSLEFAVVLEPEVTRERCGEMLYVMIVAFGDAAGALCPPEISITFQWPNAILMNRAMIGTCGLDISETEHEGIPEWMVLSIKVAIRPERITDDPGKEAWRTTMWDEGCGEISRTSLLESVSRHFLNWVHTWTEEGFRSVHENFVGRLADEKLVSTLSEVGFVALDESGNAIVKQQGGTVLLDTLSTLQASGVRS